MKKVMVIVVSLAGTFLTEAREGIYEWTCEGPYGADVYCIAVNPKNPDILYAGTNVGIYKSTDGGENWKRVRNTGSKFLTIDPNNPEVVYAEENKPFYDKPVIDIGYTENGGKTWKTCEVAIMTEGRETCVAIDPRDSKVIYVGTEENGIYKTTDGGKNWQKIRITGTNFLTIHPKNPDIIYAEPDVHFHAKPDIDIGYSFDAGRNWYFKPLTDSVGMSGEITCVDIDPYTGEIYIGANYNSDSSGISEVKFPYYIWRANAELTEMEKLLIAPYHQGWYKTSSILVIRSGDYIPPSVYVTTDYDFSPHIFQSEDGGNNWRANDFDDKCEKINQIVMGKDSALYVATNVKYARSIGGDFRYDNTGGVFKSTNLGENWQRKVKGISDYKIESILVCDGKALPVLPDSTQHGLRVVEDPNEEGTIYAAVFHAGCVVAHHIKKGKCTSNGIVWEEGDLYFKIERDIFTALAISPDGKTLIAATSDKIITGSKNEAGEWSWTERETDLNITAIYIAPSGEVFYGTDNGVWVYSDSRGEFENIGLEGITINCLKNLPGRGYLYLYAGTNQGVKICEAHTLPYQWRRAGLDDKVVKDVIFEGPIGMGEQYAATDGQGVYYKFGRADWRPINTGLTDLHVNCLVKDGDKLYAGTNTGMFMYQERTSITGEIPAPSPYFFAISPNPFNSKARVSAPDLQDVKITIYNILGQVVKEIQNPVYWDGKDFSGRKVTPGVYFCKLEIGGKVKEIRRMVILK